MKKRILVNVYDTTELIDFLKPLINEFDIFATEQNIEFLQNEGLKTEKFDWKDFNFDILITNFYPLKNYINKNIEEEEVLKHYDTEGISILEKAVKNYKNTIIITSPNQYKNIAKLIKENNTDENYQRQLALEAITEINGTNGILANILDESDSFLALNETSQMELLYGENPHQKAKIYGNSKFSYEVINETQLSYNDILDLNCGLEIASEFYDVNACVISCHAMPCAVALGSSLEEACIKALDCDPVSILGGTGVFTKTVNDKLAKTLSSMILGIVAAPEYTDEALDILQLSKIKIIKLNSAIKDYKTGINEEIKITPLGILKQTKNNSELKKETFKVVSKKKPTTEIVEDMVFAWKVAKHARSNAVVIAKDLKTSGISQGATNKIEAIDSALNKACENTKDAVLATDGAIMTKDAVFDCVQARIAGIIQTGGSTAEKEIIDTVNKYEIIMIETGIRQYKNR